jgi:hypothetical protein
MGLFTRNKKEREMDAKAREYFRIRTWIFYEAKALGYSSEDMVQEMRNCGF